ncbi:MAG: DUF1330 domain-containing protein [Enterobacterales bacterium endosymbiont of Blomia tropicalis]|uniref:DUF1330 domain-containing protein n=1 Tax=Mixta mediterraneensis TaxID=2758443 RepID=UPI0025A74EC0|nr:DUF1330 domain-containing protein [Mixta mediterraneensis]MDL4915170.1 DUF1330 domain-containing protein [Mixta mediterraneensis]
MAAYWIAHVNIKDPAQYKNYMDLAPAAFRRFNARFLARGGEAETLEGTPFQKHVVIEFDDYQSALQCYHSPEYQRARAEREAVADALITLVDGL